MAKGDRVARPSRSTEFEIFFGGREAERGWRDLLATQRNALASAWDILTRSPQTMSATCSPLRDNLSRVTHNGTAHDQWQLRLSGGARIWYYVDGLRVVLVHVHTRHPNQTK